MIERVAVYLLAGGRSSRFGFDKARAETPEGPLLRHVVARLEPIANRFTVVADRIDKYADLGLQTIADAYPGRGPLFTLYHTRLLSQVTELMEGSTNAGPTRLLETAQCQAVSMPEGSDGLPQANTAADLQRLFDPEFTERWRDRGYAGRRIKKTCTKK